MSGFGNRSRRTGGLGWDGGRTQSGDQETEYRGIDKTGKE